MTLLRLDQFLGANKQVNPRLLAPGIGVNSVNQKPGRGDLRPWSGSSNVATVPGGQMSLYRMGRDVRDPARYWLSWATDVDAVRGFDVNDPTERTYYTGDGAPKVTDNIMALDTPPYPTFNRPLGMPAPLTAPLITSQTPGDESTLMETYFYVYTYVNDWGWESGPSPVSNELDQYANGTIKVSNFAGPPAGSYNVQKIRIYRTQTGTTGTADFYYVDEIPIGTAEYIDDKDYIGEILPTTFWLPAPDNLIALTSMWNGMLAGISDRGVRFCEPYIPYAWPLQYELVPPDSTPVGLGVFSQTLVVLTTRRPMLLAGSSPDAMDQRVLEMQQACIAKRSIVSMGHGVAWASDDGLCFFGTEGGKMLTGGIMTREDWQKLKPGTIIGCMHEGLYFGTYDDTGTGLRKGFFVNPASGSGMYFLGKGFPAMHYDELLDQLFVLDGTRVAQWDKAGVTALTALFTSGLTHMPRPVVGFACAEVVADGYPVTLTITADGVERYTIDVVDPNPVRLPGGYYGQNWQVTVATAQPVVSVAMAHSITELMQV
jgi:hypothetical protein